MFRLFSREVAGEYSGMRARDHVARLSQFHRIQASPGFRAAAQYCREVLAGFGIQVEVLSFPANESTSYWGAPMLQEWEGVSATLHLVSPAENACKLADFAEIPTSLIQRSAPVENLETEVVLLDNGEEEQEYEGLELRNKVVLTRGSLDRVHELAVGQHGAAGILYDGIREVLPARQRIDLPDARQYSSFWWRPGSKRCFGFVLSPRQGENLRSLIKSQQALGKPPARVRSTVVSRLYDGHLEVVAALIPGETDEEVVAVAHLCHPRPSANDNASGAAALLESARTLQHLIKAGALPRPRRGIRLLWVPEMRGTYAYLATHEPEIPRMVAGVNLDMVGQDQEQCGSVFVIESPPAALPSFAPDLLQRLREEWMGEMPNLAGGMPFPLFRHAVSPFSGGSDHYILSDPSVGVPTPMLIQWPDKFYHTSEDTLDKVSPHMLAVVGGLATAYACFAANARDHEVRWLGREMNARFRARLARSVQDCVTEGLAEKDKELALVAARGEKLARFAADRQREALRTLLRLAPGEAPLIETLCTEADESAHSEIERLRAALAQHARSLGLDAVPLPVRPQPDEWEKQATTLVPVRRYRGPVSTDSYTHRLTAQEKEEVWSWSKRLRDQHEVHSTLASYWVDGRRTVAEIIDLVELETGQRSAELLVRHFRLLDRLGLMALESR